MKKMPKKGAKQIKDKDLAQKLATIPADLITTFSTEKPSQDPLSTASPKKNTPQFHTEESCTFPPSEDRSFPSASAANHQPLPPPPPGHKPKITAASTLPFLTGKNRSEIMISANNFLRGRLRVHDPRVSMPPSSSPNSAATASSDSEREKIREFWLSLSETKRKALVFQEKEVLLKMWREKQRLTCTCLWCDRKKAFVGEEIQMLYETYYQVLDEYTRFLIECKKQGKRIPTDEFPEFGRISHSANNTGYGQTALSFAYSNSALKHGLISVAEDLLRNQGRKFLDIMERIAERKLRREYGDVDPHKQPPPATENCCSCAANASGCCSSQDNDSDYETEGFEDDDNEENDCNEDSYEDDDFLDEEEGEPYLCCSCSASKTCSECEQAHEDEQLEEIFHLIAAMTFEQRVAVAYREFVALESQKKLLQEEEERERQAKEKENCKQEKKEKKKPKKPAAKKAGNSVAVVDAPLFELAEESEEEKQVMLPDEDPIEEMIRAKQRAIEEQRAKQREEKAKEERLREERKERLKEEKLKEERQKKAKAKAEEKRLEEKKAEEKRIEEKKAEEKRIEEKKAEERKLEERKAEERKLHQLNALTQLNERKKFPVPFTEKKAPIDTPPKVVTAKKPKTPSLQTTPTASPQRLPKELLSLIERQPESSPIEIPSPPTPCDNSFAPAPQPNPPGLRPIPIEALEASIFASQPPITPFKEPFSFHVPSVFCTPAHFAPVLPPGIHSIPQSPFKRTIEPIGKRNGPIENVWNPLSTCSGTIFDDTLPLPTANSACESDSFFETMLEYQRIL